MEQSELSGKLSKIMGALIDELLAMGEHKSCIGAGALMTNVLARTGFVGAFPLTVHAQVLNPAATNFAKTHGWVPSDKQPPAEASVIMVGQADESLAKDVWPGHLVVIIPNALGDKHVMLDPTIIQASKPEWGINLRPLCMFVMDDFTSGQMVRRVEVNGCTIIYKAQPDDKSYNQTGIWEKIIAGEAVTERVLKRLVEDKPERWPPRIVVKPSARPSEKPKTPKERAAERKKRRKK